MLWHTALGSEQNIYLAEFPKSGGTWLAQLLSELTGLSFPRNMSISKQPCILHGHHISHLSGRKTIHMVRDGRDVMVSAYHYFLLNSGVSESTRSFWTSLMPRDVNINDVRSGMPAFIRQFHSHYRSGFSNKTWAVFIDCYDRYDEVSVVRYEDLLQNPEEVLHNLLSSWDIKTDASTIRNAVEKYSFKNQKRDDHSASNFLRKGIVGDWKNFFNKESAKVFDLYAGDALIKAGYEKDKTWY